MNLILSPDISWCRMTFNHVIFIYVSTLWGFRTQADAGRELKVRVSDRLPFQLTRWWSDDWAKCQADAWGSRRALISFQAYLA